MEPVVTLHLPSQRAVLLLALAAVAACGRSAPVTQPPLETPATNAVELRYAAQSWVEEVDLMLTHTSVGQYVEAELHGRAAVALELEGDALRTRWSLQGVDGLTLTGTVAADEHHQARGLLLARGKGIAIGDVHGLVDLEATDAAAINVARLAAMGADAPPSGVLLMAALAEQLRLPRLPAKSLAVGESLEVQEESETVITSGEAELVLPTTAGHRFTLRGIDDEGGVSVADLAIASASIAQLEDDGSEAVARIEIRSEARLLFDLDHGAPVSLELSRSESFSVGGVDGERSLSLRARFRNH